MAYALPARVHRGKLREYELVYRVFERTLIHERRYVYTGQSERSFAFSYFDSVTHHYFENQLLNIRLFGLPEPKQGSFSITDLGLQRIGIYMDDMCLCPNCGSYFFKAEAPYIFNVIRTARTPFKRVMKELITARADVPEFTILTCPGLVECAERRSRQERANRRDQTIDITEVNARPRPRSVYLVRTGKSYKIGIAVDVAARIRALQCACPYEIVLVKSWTSSDARQRERMLHDRFKKYRTSGEWFDLPDAEVQLLTELGELPTMSLAPRLWKILDSWTTGLNIVRPTMNFAHSLSKWGTDQFSDAVLSDLAANESDIPLDEACDEGGGPDWETVPDFKVSSFDEKPNEIVVSTTVYFIESIPTACKDANRKERRQAELLVRIDRKTGNADVEIDANSARQNLEYY